MGRWVNTLNQAMDYYVGERGAKDKESITSIQNMSVKITEVLLDTITEDKVNEAISKDAKAKELKETLEVFANLDKVRSSPATPLAQDKIKEYNVALLRRKLLEAQATIKEVTTPERLGTSVKQVLKTLGEVVKIFEQTKPDAKMVQGTVLLLKGLVQKLIALVPAALQKDMALYHQAEFCAQQIDKFAVRLQPFAPAEPWKQCTLAVKQLAVQFEQRKSAAMAADEEVQLQLTVQSANQELQKAQDELDKVTGFNPKVVADAFDTLAPLWPKAQKDSKCTDRLKAVCGAVEARVLESVDKALAEPQETAKPKVQGLLGFAQTYDKSKSQLIKAEGTGLVGSVKVKLDEARKAKDTAAVEKAIEEAGQLVGAAEEELNKDSHFNPKVVVESLEKLVPVWQQGQSIENRQRLKQVYNTVENRVIESAMKALQEKQGAKVEGLKKFGDTYDEIWCKLEERKVDHTEDEGGSHSGVVHLGLKERIGMHEELDKNLRTAEDELGKEHGMNTPLVVGALKELRVPWEQVDGRSNEAYTTRLEVIMTTITNRVTESFEKAVAEDSPKKQEALLQFASNYDATCAGLLGAYLAKRGKLEDKLASSDAAKQKREEQVDPKLKAIEEGFQNEPVATDKILQGFVEIQPFWEKRGVSEEMNSRLEKVKNSFCEHVKTTYSQSLAQNDDSVAEQLRKSAQQYDLICLKMAGFAMPDADDEWAKEFKGPLCQELSKMQEIHKAGK